MFVPLWIVIIRMLIIRKYIFNFERISFAVSRGPKVFLGVHYFSVQSGTSSSFSAMTHRVPRTHTITQTLDPLARLVLVRKRRAGGKMIWQLLRRAITELKHESCCVLVIREHLKLVFYAPNMWLLWNDNPWSRLRKDLLLFIERSRCSHLASIRKFRDCLCVLFGNKSQMEKSIPHQH